MAGTLETAGGMIGSAVVNAAAVAAAIVILRSGRASDPRLIAGAMAYYLAVKQTGKLNGAEFGKALDDLLKKEYGIDVDKILEQQFEEHLMPILKDYLGYKDTWDEWLDSTANDPIPPQGFDDLLKDYQNGDTSSDPDLTYDPSKFNPNTPDRDTDNDGIPDWLDPDMDGDDIPDGADSDRDGDGIPDAIDPDPLTPEPNPDDGHPFDPVTFDPPRRHDPLALDMNQDGLISTVSLADSTAYFDLTGDGIKEKVGWIQAADGLVAYDKNGNGKIDGIGEVFGTPTVNGFDELRRIADSNYDGIIDRRDELYNQLKVWQDTNQDGISQANELKTLSEAGVKNIQLDVIGTNINLNGNLLSEAGRYTDSAGDRELAADIQLTFDARITTIDTSTIPDYTVHPESLTLPNLRGFGVVMDTSIAYNVNDTLRAMGVAYAADITKVATGFDAFMAQWSVDNFKRKVA